MIETGLAEVTNLDPSLLNYTYIPQGPYDPDEQLLTELAAYSTDPLGFVYWAFPWGEPGDLEEFDGPDDWQIDYLRDLRDGVISFEEAMKDLTASTEPILMGRTSGHGIGKSALVAWLIWWAISTEVDTKGVVTANTESQLKTKTWAEVAKWHRMFLAKDLFVFAATRIYSADPNHASTWRIDMVPWSEKRPEAFAGLHNKGKRVLIIFDEASAIPDVIWEVVGGVMSDDRTQIIWSVFGNPTVTDGRFRDCFAGGKFAHRWKTAEIDSRDAKMTNKVQIQNDIDDWGIDHDYVRVRWLGKFPRQSANTFISIEKAQAAVKRRPENQQHHPVVMGVDVARLGNDKTVLYPRQGADAQTRMPLVLSKLRTTETTRIVMRMMVEWNVSMIFVDEGGVGGGVVDMLLNLRAPVMGVDSSTTDFTSLKGEKLYNMRANMWTNMAHWLDSGCIVDAVPRTEALLTKELAAPLFKHRNEKILLESKDEMRKRKIESPNMADALALTFAYPDLVIPQDIPMPEETSQDYNPYTSENIYGSVS